MDKEHKKKIRQYRLSGMGFKSIANTLDLKVDAVRQYCKNNGLDGPAEYVKYNNLVWGGLNQRCPVCGKKLKQPKIGRKKTFCSGKCRTKHCREKVKYNIVFPEVSETIDFPNINDFPEFGLVDDYENFERR